MFFIFICLSSLVNFFLISSHFHLPSNLFFKCSYTAIISSTLLPSFPSSHHASLFLSHPSSESSPPSLPPSFFFPLSHVVSLFPLLFISPSSSAHYVLSFPPLSCSLFLFFSIYMSLSFPARWTTTTSAVFQSPVSTTCQSSAHCESFTSVC